MPAWLDPATPAPSELVPRTPEPVLEEPDTPALLVLVPLTPILLVLLPTTPGAVAPAPHNAASAFDGLRTFVVVADVFTAPRTTSPSLPARTADG
jgi:hypothetical protein